MKIKRLISAVTSLALAFSLAACGSIENANSNVNSKEEPSTVVGSDPEPSDPDDPDSPDILTPPTTIYDSMLVSGKTKANDNIEGKDADDAFISSQYDFAAELFKNSYDSGASTLVSPLSVMLALSMTANGADGNTLTEMQNVLGGGMDINDLSKYLYTYSQSSGNDDINDGAKLLIANSIWCRDIDELNVKEEFLQKNTDYYGASVFKSAFDSLTVDAINSWVTDNTDGMINRIVDQIAPETMMYLINAITFDAEWRDAYEDYQINEGKFTDILGNEQDVQMMYSAEDIYLDDGNATGFIKYYKGGSYAFAALLPNEDVAIGDYVASLTGESLAEALTPKYGYSVQTRMPKFSFDYDISLNEVLKGMGMPSAFDSGADFSRMSDMTLYISNVLHKTHIEVDENGTKAAAVTSVAMDNEAAMIVEDIVYVTLDRPFVFAIIDTHTNLPVFIGATLTIE